MKNMDCITSFQYVKMRFWIDRDPDRKISDRNGKRYCLTEQRIVVSGDRNYTNRDRVKRCFDQITYPNVELIHGDCQGLDRIAGPGEAGGKSKGWTVISMPAQWDIHGKAAEPIRNGEMLDMIPPNGGYVIWFHDNIEESKGTKNMINQATTRAIPVYCGNSY